MPFQSPRLLLPAALLCAALPLAAPAQTPPPPAVIVAPAAQTQVTEQATFIGRALATQKVDLRARVSGFLEERGFQEGSVVAQGTVLFRIEPQQYEAALAEAEASLASAEATAALARLELDRQTELVGRQAVAQAQLDRAQAEAARAEADVKRATAQRDAAALNLSYTQVMAPFAGKVGLSPFDVGALIGPDSGALVTLVRTDPMTVEFPVTERDLLAYRAGVASGAVSDQGQINLMLADGSEYPLPGQINFTDVTVSTATDTVLIRAVFPNPDDTLRDGSLVRVTLSNDKPLLSLTVPQQAVQRDLTGAFVMVVDEAGLVEQRRVEVDRLTGGNAIIESGLAEGERVITEGVNKARPGMTVDAALAGEG
jgi:membrane fusion protein, multidrug efflux system